MRTSYKRYLEERLNCKEMEYDALWWAFGCSFWGMLIALLLGWGNQGILALWFCGILFGLSFNYWQYKNGIVCGAGGLKLIISG